MLKKLGKIWAAIVIVITLETLLNRNIPEHKDLSENVSCMITTKETGETKFYNGLYFPITNKGDKVVVKIDLPESKKIDDSALAFYIYHCTLKVSYKDKVIYRYGDDLKKKGEMIGAIYPVINIPNEAWGSHLTIEMNVTEDNAFTQFNKPYVYHSGDGSSYSIERNIMSFFVSVSGIVLGITFIMITFILGEDIENWGRTITMSWFIINICLFLLCYYGQYNIIASKASVPIWNQIEFYSLYSIAIPIMLYVITLSDGIEKKILTFFTVVNILFICLVFILNATGVRHINTMLLPGHVFNIIGVISVAITCIKQRMSGNKDSQHVLLGMAALGGIGLIDILRFYFVRYNKLDWIINDDVFLPIGVCIIAFVLILSYIEDVKARAAKRQGQLYLESIAYIDPLTTLANRTKMDEYLDDLRDSNRDYFAFIYLDLNNLKKTNDTKGHPYGDELLKKFGELISKYFSKMGKVGRIGGDEFLIIITEYEETEIMEKLVEMDKEKDGMSYGYGVACCSKDNPLSVDEALQIADKNMYEMKKNQKNK